MFLELRSGLAPASHAYIACLLLIQLICIDRGDVAAASATLLGAAAVLALYDLGRLDALLIIRVESPDIETHPMPSGSLWGPFHFCPPNGKSPASEEARLTVSLTFTIANKVLQQAWFLAICFLASNR